MEASKRRHGGRDYRGRIQNDRYPSRLFSSLETARTSKRKTNIRKKKDNADHKEHVEAKRSKRSRTRCKVKMKATPLSHVAPVTTNLLAT
jgi:hypothetical protein